MTEEDYWEDFNRVWKSVGLTMDEVTDAVNHWLIQLAESIADDGVDASNGMTLDELIPETIAEWRQLKDDL